MFNSKEYCRRNAEKARVQAKKWYQANRARRLASDAIRRNNSEYKEWFKIYFKDYYQKNKDKMLAQNKAYRSRPEYLKEKANTHRKNMRENPNYRFAHIFRTRIITAIKRQYCSKAYKSIELLGCGIDVARQHIEKQFKEGMSWDNHGMFTWHIDHKIPLDAFDLTKPEEQKKAFHFTNLQPLFAQDNLKKSYKHNDDIGRSA